MNSGAEDVRGHASGRLTLGDLVIDVRDRSVSRAGEPIRLPDLSFDVLVHIALNAPNVVSSRSLAESVWESGYVAAGTIAQRIKLLRQSLGDDTRSPKYIRTVRSRGYVCVAPVGVAAKPGVVPGPRRRAAAGAGLAVISMVAAMLITAVQDLPPMRGDGGVEGDEPPPIVGSMVRRARDLLDIQKAEETEMAIEILRQALDVDPDDSNAAITLSFALSTRVTKFATLAGDDAGEAEALARRVIGEDPGRDDAWHALAYALDARGRVDEALNFYKRAFELNPQDVAAMSGAAYLLAVRGHLFEALRLEARALSQGDYSIYADVQIALLLDLVGHPAADHWWSRARMLSRNRVVVLAEAAAARLRTGQPGAALQELAAASGDDADAPRLHRMRGRAYLSLGNTAAAKRSFKAAGSRGSIDLASLEAREGDDRRASRLIESARLSMFDGDSWPGLRIGLAELHAALGDVDGALLRLSQAVDLGWRDTGTVETSPFLDEVTASKEWRSIRARIERELSVQRQLIDGDPGLSGVLTVPAMADN